MWRILTIVSARSSSSAPEFSPPVPYRATATGRDGTEGVRGKTPLIVKLTLVFRAARRLEPWPSGQGFDRRNEGGERNPFLVCSQQQAFMPVANFWFLQVLPAMFALLRCVRALWVKCPCQNGGRSHHRARFFPQPCLVLPGQRPC